MALNDKLKILSRAVGIGEKEDMFTAERAWIETSYGGNSYTSIEQRIKDKQSAIRRRIEGKACDGQPVTNLANTYYCFVKIEEDLLNVVDCVFEPFVAGGFDVISISNKVEELSGENIYLVSWAKAFSKPKQTPTPDDNTIAINIERRDA